MPTSNTDTSSVAQQAEPAFSFPPRLVCAGIGAWTCADCQGRILLYPFPRRRRHGVCATCGRPAGVVRRWAA
jgi:hypothetical protein